MIEKRVYPGAPSVITESSLGASDSDIPDQSKSIVFFLSHLFIVDLEQQIGKGISIAPKGPLSGSGASELQNKGQGLQNCR